MRTPLGRAYAQNMHSLDSGRLVKIAHPGLPSSGAKKPASDGTEAVKEGHLAISTLAHAGGIRRPPRSLSAAGIDKNLAQGWSVWVRGRLALASA